MKGMLTSLGLIAWLSVGNSKRVHDGWEGIPDLAAWAYFTVLDTRSIDLATHIADDP